MKPSFFYVERVRIVCVKLDGSMIVGSMIGGWLLEKAPGSHAPYAASVLVASLGGGGAS